MKRRAPPPEDSGPDTLSLFSPSEVEAAKPARQDGEGEESPPGTAEKLAMRPSVDDGRPARRKLHTLKNLPGYRVEATRQVRIGRSMVEVPVEVSRFCMDTRTYWIRVEGDAIDNPMMELERSVPESPPIGEQWRNDAVRDVRH